MKTNTFIPMLNLQIFADGGAGAAGAGNGDGGTAQGTGVTGAAAVPQKGVSGALGDVKYGVQEQPAAPAPEVQNETVAKPDRNAEFEKLIKGEYKDLYDARVQDTVQKRLKSTRETVDKYNELTPVLEILGKKYGVDPTNIKALNKAIEDDDSYFQEEALSKGLTVEQLKNIRKMERENAELKAQMNEQKRKDSAAQQYAAWMKQAEEAKRIYPSLDLNTEAKNPQFLQLLNAGIDVGSAYLVIHKDDIIPAAMQHAAKTAEQKVTNNVMANRARPSENGMSAQSAAVVKSDVSQLSREDIAEIGRRVARGERISFG